MDDSRPDDLPLLLSSAEIEAMPPQDKTHFLNPRAVRRQRSLGDATGLTHIGVHLVDIEPGFEATEFHVHHFEEECVYVLEGEGTLELGDERHPIAAGDFLGLPAGRMAHNIINTGKGRLRLLVMGERLTHDVADYPRQGKRLFRNDGVWELVDHDTVTRLTPGLPARGRRAP